MQITLNFTKRWKNEKYKKLAVEVKATLEADFNAVPYIRYTAETTMNHNVETETCEPFLIDFLKEKIRHDPEDALGSIVEYKYRMFLQNFLTRYGTLIL